MTLAQGVQGGFAEYLFSYFLGPTLQILIIFESGEFNRNGVHSTTFVQILHFVGRIIGISTRNNDFNEGHHTLTLSSQKLEDRLWQAQHSAEIAEIANFAAAESPHLQNQFTLYSHHASILLYPGWAEGNRLRRWWHPAESQSLRSKTNAQSQ